MSMFMWELHFYHRRKLAALWIIVCDMVYRFLLINDVDPTGQLSWLTSVLQQAEEQGEKVNSGFEIMVELTNQLVMNAMDENIPQSLHN